jgi:hypothetical protein
VVTLGSGGVCTAVLGPNTRQTVRNASPTQEVLLLGKNRQNPLSGMLLEREKDRLSWWKNTVSLPEDS